jgi:CheY-like chemotaxis protein
MEAVGQLTGGVAHDFNNILMVILANVEELLEGDGLSDEQREMLTNVAGSGERAAELTRRLLAFSRKQRLTPQPTNVGDLIAGTDKLLRRTLGEQIEIEAIFADDVWITNIDRSQLEAALVNLCVNARDAMPDGGRLTIETSNTHLDEAYAAEHSDVAAGQYVMVSVTDTGCGMPAEVIERAFDPFYTTKAVGSGTGLGLSQVYGFVKQSGGHVKIYSEPGVGTTVKLYVPRHFGVAEAPGAAVDRPELPRANRHETVLVVEDEERVRLVSVDSLRELGYIVFHADGPGQALAMLGELPRVDLLFTDVIMPDMNGRKLAEAARVERPDLKVLYTTGYTKNAIVHNGMLDHDVAFLPKPFTVAQLAAKVRQVLDA